MNRRLEQKLLIRIDEVSAIFSASICDFELKVRALERITGVLPAIGTQQDVEHFEDAVRRFWEGRLAKSWLSAFHDSMAIYYESESGGRPQIRGMCRAATEADYAVHMFDTDYEIEKLTDDDYKPLPETRQRLTEIRRSLQSASRAFAKANNRLVEDASKIKGAFRTVSAEEARASLAAFRREHPDIADLWKVVAEDRLECVHDEVLCVQQFMRETGMSEQPEIAVESPYMPGVDEYETPQPMKTRRFLLLMILLSLAAHIGLLFWVAYVQDLPIWRVL